MTKVDKIMAQVAILIDVEKGNGKHNEFHATYDKLRTIIEDAVSVTAGWQPIETMPIDSGSYLVADAARGTERKENAVRKSTDTRGG